MHEIGASEISAVMGNDPWKSPQELYEAKRTSLVEPENPHMARGRILEPALCNWWLYLSQGENQAARYAVTAGALLKGNGQLEVRHPRYPWARATPDLIAFAEPIRQPKDAELNPFVSQKTLISVDVKAPTSQSRKVAGGAWEKVWNEETQTAPFHYREQVIYQQGVLRAAGIPVAAGELGAGPFFGKLHRVAVDYDDEYFSICLARAGEFLEFLNAGQPLPESFRWNHAKPE